MVPEAPVRGEIGRVSRHAIFVGSIGAIFASPNLLISISAYDGGLAASAGTFLLHSGLPYRDFWWLYGPLAPVVAAVPTALLGPSLLLIRLLGLAMVGIQTGAGYALLRPRIAHTPATLICVGAATSATFILGSDLSAWGLALALALTGLTIRSHRPDRPVLAGVLVGLAFLARLDVGAYAVIAALLVGGRRPFVAGVAAIVLPIAALAVVLAPMSALYDQLIWFPLIGTRQYRSLPWPEVMSVAAGVLVLATVIVPKLAIAAAIARLALGADRPGPLLVITVFAALCQLQTLGRGDLYHHAQTAFPAYVALAWVGAPVLSRIREPIPLVRSVTRLAGFAAVSAATALTLVTGSLGPTRIETGPMPGKEAELIAGIRTLARNSRPDEPVFVGLTDHRHTLLNDMVAYYLADRRTGVHVALFNPGVTNTDVVQAGMAADLEASGTSILLLDDAWADAYEPDNDSAIAGSTVLDEAISARYIVACDFDSIRILATPERAPSVTCAAVDPNERLLDILTRVMAR